MSLISSTPSIVPGFDVAVHIVLDDFGAAGKIYRETDEADAGLDATVDYLLSGQYNNPLRVVAFNTAEGWSRDVSEDVAWELVRRAAKDGKPIPAATRGFVELHLGEEELLRVESGLV
jgi:hypothetical protein